MADAIERALMRVVGGVLRPTPEFLLNKATPSRFEIECLARQLHVDHETWNYGKVMSPWHMLKKAQRMECRIIAADLLGESADEEKTDGG